MRLGISRVMVRPGCVVKSKVMDDYSSAPSIVMIQVQPAERIYCREKLWCNRPFRWSFIPWTSKCICWKTVRSTIWLVC